MKKYLYTAIAALTLSFSAIAQTNETKLPDVAAVPDGKEFGSYELTLGGGGTHINGDNAFGLDVSLSSNPIRQLPNLWLGVTQGAYWEPTFAGSTDINANWNWHLWKQLYLNTGWSVGAVYDSSNLSWRTGPEATFQYYVADNAFLYTGVNYDIPIRGGDRGFRYSFGIGLAF